MGRFAQATRISKAQLRGAGQQARAMRSQVDPEELQASRAALVKMMRRAPKRMDLEDLAERVQQQWEPQTTAQPAKPAPKPAATPNDDAKSAKTDLLREVLAAAKSFNKLAKNLNQQVKQGEEAYAIMAVPVKAIIRAPHPTIRFTSSQMDEMLGLFLLFITLIERYAKRLKGG